MLSLGAVTITKKLVQDGAEHELVLRVRPPDPETRKTLQRLVKEDRLDEGLRDLFTPAVLAQALDGWEGLAGPDGAPLPCTPETVAQVCAYSDVLQVALLEAVLEATPQLVRGNSKPSPLGSRTDGGETLAPPAMR